MAVPCLVLFGDAAQLRARLVGCVEGLTDAGAGTGIH